MRIDCKQFLFTLSTMNDSGAKISVQKSQSKKIQFKLVKALFSLSKSKKNA